MDKLIYRYGLPGLPISIILYIAYAGFFNIENPETQGIPFILSLSLVLGYFIHQGWMLAFETLDSFRYDSPDRKVLKRMNSIISNIVENTGEENKSVEGRKLNQFKKIVGEIKNPYILWDTLLYSRSVPPDIRTKDRGMWNSYHTNMGNAIGFILGFIGFVGLYASNADVRSLISCFGFLLILVFCTITCLVLYKKATATKRLVETLEEFWADTYFFNYANELSQDKFLIMENEND